MKEGKTNCGGSPRLFREMQTGGPKSQQNRTGREPLQQGTWRISPKETQEPGSTF